MAPSSSTRSATLTTLKTPTRPTNTSESRHRLDVAVASQLGCSRRHAQALILAGRVHVGASGAVLKAGSLVAKDELIAVQDDAQFVGRGAAKLERALDEFGWPVDGLRCLDVGASTGGFTDCLLQRGAASVTAVDVGYGQLAWKLRNDARVTIHERCNFRHADVGVLGAPFAFACVDVSFISLSKLASNLSAAVEPGGHLIALVKPQFEAGRSAVGKGGVVRDPRSQIGAIDAVIESMSAAGLAPVKLTNSPIKGPAGNIEFLLGVIRDGALREADRAAIDVAGVVNRAHEALAR